MKFDEQENLMAWEKWELQCYASRHVTTGFQIVQAIIKSVHLLLDTPTLKHIFFWMFSVTVYSNNSNAPFE